MRSNNPSAPWNGPQYSNNQASPSGQWPEPKRPGPLHTMNYTSMPFPTPSILAPLSPPSPSFLAPGAHRGHSAGANVANLTFQSPSFDSRVRQHSSASAHPQSPPPLPPPPVPRHPFHRAVTSPPVVPPKPSYVSPPTLPPKIPLSPRSTPSPVRRPSSKSTGASTPNESLPSPFESSSQETEERELWMALALSAAEAKNAQSQLSAQETEEIERALRESILSEESKSYFPTMSPEVIQTSLPDDTPSAPGSSTMQVQSSNASSSHFETRQNFRPDPWPSSPPELYRSSQMAEDEALARQLAAEEEELSKSDMLTEEQLPDLPMYTPSVASIVHSPGTGPGSLANTPPTEVSHSLESDVGTSLQNTSSASSSASHDSISDPPIWRSSDVDTLNVGTPANNHLIRSTSPRPLSHMLSNCNLSSLGESNEGAKARSEPSQAPVNANHFVEPELLRGISLGFHAPVISSELNMMRGPMPNIISLPYGKCPPLHLQAPNWRQLLKLMAALSGTRVEPTLEAMAAVKVDLHLRVVIQFVKVHHSSPQWRTILWLTLDYPIPDTAAGAWKYSNGDVSVLPYSYSFSSIPALLRDCSDSPMAKSYTIPATPNTPYPKLPITFPNLAMYLHSALDDSRRLAHDSSSGIRKLAKMVDACYPNDAELNGLGGETERRGVTGLFKKVIGRGRQTKGRGGNEDTFELVTPFIPDEEY